MEDDGLSLVDIAGEEVFDAVGKEDEVLPSARVKIRVRCTTACVIGACPPARMHARTRARARAHPYARTACTIASTKAHTRKHVNAHASARTHNAQVEDFQRVVYFVVKIEWNYDRVWCCSRALPYGAAAAF